MNNINNWKYKCIDTLLFLSAGSLFVWGIVCAILTCVGFAPQHREIFMQVIIIMLVLRVVFINKYTAIVSLIVVFLTAMATIVNLQIDPYFAGSFEKAAGFVYDIIRYIGGYVPYRQAYEIVITWAVCGAVSLFAAVFIVISFRFFALFGLTAAVFAVTLSYGGFSYELPFLAGIFALLIFLAKYLTAMKSGKKMFSLNAVAIVILCFCTAYFLPSPKEGFADAVAETALYKPLKAVNAVISEVFAPKYFTLSSSGYLRKDGRLGGDITLTDDLVLEIAIPERWLPKPLYFAGAIKDTYTGWSWENTAQEIEPADFSEDTQTVEFLEVMFSNLMISLENGEFEEIVKILEKPERILNTWYISRCDYIQGGTLTIQMEQSLYKLKNAEINMRGSKTYSVFSPQRIVGVEKDNDRLPVVKDGQNNLTSEVLLTKNSSYTVSYREDPYESYGSNMSKMSYKGIYEEILEFLRQLHEKYNFDKNQVSVLLDSSLDEDKLNMHMFKMYPAGEEYFNPEISMNYEDLLIDIFIPRAREIYELYTQLPENFPERIRTLANDVVKNAEDDYSKAKAIATFLRKYPYTFTPGDVPEDRDFVDYFLFEGQTGYCTYFASAFVTMCRAVGLPARYVEGYVTPLEKNESGYYAVTKKQGHAWGEVYFEGYGWVQFEPTPHSSSPGRPELLPTAEQYPFKQYEIETDNATATETEYVSATESANIFDFAAPQTQETQKKKEKSIWENIINNFIITILVLSAAVALFMYVRFLISRKNERNIDKKINNEAAGLYFHILLRYLKFFRYEKAPGETIAQYADKIGARVSFANNTVSMGDIAEILSRARYGKEQISDEDMKMIKRALKDIDVTMRRSVGMIRYIYYRYAARVV